MTNYTKAELAKMVSDYRKKKGVEGKALSGMKQGVLLGLAKRYKLVAKTATVGASGAKKAKSPAKKGKSPAKKAKSPAKKGKSPAKKAKSPAKKAKSPAKKAKSPAKKAKSPAKKTGAKLCPGKVTRGKSVLTRRDKESTASKCVYTRKASPSKKGKSPAKKGKSPAKKGKSRK